MKKLVAVLGATVLSLGLVTACDQSSGSDGSSGSSTQGGAVGDGGGSDGDAQGEGGIDVRQWFDDYVAANGKITTAHVVIDQQVSVGGQSVPNHMEIDMDATKGAYSMTMEMMGMPATVVLLDGTAYVKAGGPVQQMSLEQLGMTEADMSPAADVERHRDAITKVERVGSEEINGVQTEHFVVTYDVAEMNKMLEDSNAASDGQVQGDTVTMDFWLDDEMRSVKIATTMTVAAAGSTSTVKQEAVYSDYGKPVTIEIPK